MRLTLFRTLSFLIVIALSFPPTKTSADVDPQLLNLSIKVLNAVKTLTDAVGDIKKVEGVVKDIEEHRTPSVTENQWATLAEKYRKAATELREAPLPTDFDRTKYAFSLDELTNCATRDASLAKARGYLEELKRAQQRGQEATTNLDQSLSQTDDARKALKYLIEVHDKLITVPIYNSIFTWDWFELNTNVSASLGDLTSALNSQKKKIKDELSKLSLYIPNLQGNLTSLESLPCSLEGDWKGSWTYTEKLGPFPPDTSTDQIQVKITKDAGQLVGEILIDDQLIMKKRLTNFVVNGNDVTFKGVSLKPDPPGVDFSMYFTMKTSSSGKMMTGTIKYQKRYNSTASLTKQ